MKIIFSVLVGLLFAACGQRGDKSVTVSNIDTELKYLSEQHYIDLNKDSLINNYKDYFSFSTEDIVEPAFSIHDSSCITAGNEKIFCFKIAAKAQQSWSYCEKLVVVSNHGDLLYNTEFRQIDREYEMAECGVPSYWPDTLEIITIAEKQLLAVVIEERYHPCCGHSQQQKNTLYLYDSADLSLIDSVNAYFWLPYNDSCEKKKPEEKTTSELIVGEDKLQIELSNFIGGELVNQVTRVLYEIRN
ncbi:hypothetical protein SLH46_17220 [Draconibacterium sp. IB214405]|uniref:hypothetical protein n=1 Tax=Draconibacterium sp. IB214405 TaxID=3097352 RepID=UPI002A17425C|nr:hypothetical protein [Draconibacterium sp. IB214405]MDX8340943.1 hypothetical protein [Draconibacterium sp. IB214405]